MSKDLTKLKSWISSVTVEDYEISHNKRNLLPPLVVSKRRRSKLHENISIFLSFEGLPQEEPQWSEKMNNYILLLFTQFYCAA